MSAALRLVPTIHAQQEPPQPTAMLEPEPTPATCLYRKRTILMLRRYLRASIDIGRVPSLLGAQFFRGRISSYRMHTFEDVVIFVHDMENCLARLDDFSRQVLAHTVLQEYTHYETAELLQLARKTVERAYLESLDKLTDILLEAKLLDRAPLASLAPDQAFPPKKFPKAEKSCQGGKNDDFSVSPSKRRKNKVEMNVRK